VDFFLGGEGEAKRKLQGKCTTESFSEDDTSLRTVPFMLYIIR
jgi:hypothetical protein